MIDRDAVARQALRVYERYAVEIVEALDLCPWARGARQDGRVAVRPVLTEDPADLSAAVEAEAALADDPRLEIGLLVFPLLRADRARFEAFVGALRDAHQRRHPLGRAPWAMAAFHFHAPLDPSDPERLIPFLRRSPDPTIQLVRIEVLDRVRQKHPEGSTFVDAAHLDLQALKALAAPTPRLRERIARANQESVAALGYAEFDRRLHDIRADRDRAYAALGVDIRGDAPAAPGAGPATSPRPSPPPTGAP